MPLPRGDEYLAAVQHPKTAFSDAELKARTPETDQFGIPRPYAGGFTTTFHLYNHSQQWAARCFTRAIPDLQTRYQAISRFFQKCPDNHFVKTICLSQGIRVGNQWHPIIKMEWLNGETLNSYIAKNISNLNRISNLIPEFIGLVRRLQQLGVAHGDLQHGNILVKSGKLYLIDYDGMFLPELSGFKANEIGHVNYQHPERNENYYNASLDRFASIVIYLGLQATALSPKLWSIYDNSENILFRTEDFVKVEISVLLKELVSIPQLSQLVARFRGVCRLDFNKIPTLDQFITGKFSYIEITAPKTVSVPTACIPRKSQYTIIDASRTDLLSTHIGQRIEVVGFISDIRKGWSKNRGSHIVFLNFGAYPNQTFTIVIWPSSLNRFEAAGIDPCSFRSKQVKAVGVVGSYMGKPQMIIEMPSQIQIFAGEPEARLKLGAHDRLRSTQMPQQKRIHRSEESVFNTLYASRTATPPVHNIPSPPNHQVLLKTPTSASTNSKKKNRLSLDNIGPGCWWSIIPAYWGCSLGFAIGDITGGIIGLVVGASIGYQIGKRV